MKRENDQRNKSESEREKGRTSTEFLRRRSSSEIQGANEARAPIVAQQQCLRHRHSRLLGLVVLLWTQPKPLLDLQRSGKGFKAQETKTLPAEFICYVTIDRGFFSSSESFFGGKIINGRFLKITTYLLAFFFYFILFDI